MKIDLNSIRYGTRRLSARGTNPKTSTITIAYTIGLIPDFPDNFHNALKTRAKVISRHPFCWHFCWYRGEQMFTANFLYSEREN
jgi:hypothetical protein